MSENETDEGTPEAPPGEESEPAPETVPDDWLDAKPFDPAGR